MSVRTDYFIKLYWCVCSPSVSLSLLRVIATDNHNNNDNCETPHTVIPWNCDIFRGYCAIKISYHYNPSPWLTNQISKELENACLVQTPAEITESYFLKFIFISENGKKKTTKKLFPLKSCFLLRLQCLLKCNMKVKNKTIKNVARDIKFVFIRVIVSRSLHTHAVCCCVTLVSWAEASFSVHV